MIITFLSGGLGNQMFQFAAGYALAKENCCQHKLDISFYKLYKLNRKFELSDSFNSTFEIATIKELKNILHLNYYIYRSPFFRKIYKKLKYSKRWIIEPNFEFWPDFHNIKNPCIIEGLWQSEKYLPLKQTA